MIIDFLNKSSEDRYSRNPDLLSQELKTHRPNWVILDEVQKVPKILDVVHSCIEDPSIATLFAMTGSSARKLKIEGANLLAGRAFVNILQFSR